MKGIKLFHNPFDNDDLTQAKIPNNDLIFQLQIYYSFFLYFTWAGITALIKIEKQESEYVWVRVWYQMKPRASSELEFNL